ncbi:antitoxin [Rhizobium brockwellii]|jgi:antitoxin VapB|uniref:Type II toxin-antitoxin system VapB family antitoxin n=1 Tax=Rhizobium brockwellii TaxID=3019932 RepID=A0ABU3YV25_9HYPH|nr:MULTISPECIES: type II toxin-antitoxin system VapB family antitoxin [Rhizobium]MDV4182686.1 type II toxin-antitoxin system VapB family antitoxin [Rhizobium brockwellii]MDV4189691.1 type II toxin-antitoxin system VapB family antitoxin [Rhizobium brockwellii]NZD49346.1 antitoxin [Rhizobium leguminosarum]QIO53636.1 antitoxin [Rhizobium leguminosarum bv. trifolii]TAV76384.1 antitoxin [Rhizobium leguminosarum]
METAKIFWSGRSQAVLLPKEFRFDGDSVAIRRQGRAIILEPISDDWDWIADLAGPVDADFATAVEEQPAGQQRSELDFFK